MTLNAALFEGHHSSKKKRLTGITRSAAHGKRCQYQEGFNRRLTLADLYRVNPLFAQEGSLPQAGDSILG